MVNMLKVSIVNNSKHELPAYATAHSAGLDLRANLPEPLKILPLQRVLIPTGLFMEIPAGYEGQIRPRSGLAYKHGITVLNSPGTIDSDYRGEVKIILVNLSEEAFILNDGDRIAQLVIARYEPIEWNVRIELSASVRATGGFGHTGK